MNWKPEHAFILAAGMGKRLRPYTDNCPKPLVKAAGKPLIDYALDHIQAAGIGKVTVNLHYMADMLAAHLAPRKHPLITISYEDTLMDTGGGIKRALPQIGTEPFVVVSGDSLWTNGPVPALDRMIDKWDPDKMDILLLLQPVSRMTMTRGIGDYDIAHDGKAIRRPDKSGFYMWTSVRICAPQLFENTPDGPFSFLKLMDRAEKEGRVYAVIHDADWHHITTSDDLDRVNAVLTNQKRYA
jgi:MurNAc alpha-1-phosphate uridylyltransferase